MTKRLQEQEHAVRLGNLFGETGVFLSVGPTAVEAMREDALLRLDWALREISTDIRAGHRVNALDAKSVKDLEYKLAIARECATALRHLLPLSDLDPEDPHETPSD